MQGKSENSDEKFRRLATARTNEILKRIDTLGNLSNKGQYSYTDEQVRKIFSAIDRELRLVKEKFKSANNGGEFKL